MNQSKTSFKTAHLTTEGLTDWGEATLPSSTLGFVSFVNNVQTVTRSQADIAKIIHVFAFIIIYHLIGRCRRRDSKTAFFTSQSLLQFIVSAKDILKSQRSIFSRKNVMLHQHLKTYINHVSTLNCVGLKHELTKI